MNFIHCPPQELIELEDEFINGKRYYSTPNGKFPSITSVLSSFEKKGLLEWRKRVGEEEANRITRSAANKGTKLHTLCEKYLSNEEFDNKKIMPNILESFYSIKPFLNEINNIHKLEVPLYSSRLKVAGRCDGIAEYKGILSVIDFKTSRKEKREEWIEDYFLQTTFYGMCYYEMTGIKIKQVVVLISVDDGESQEFIRPLKNYIVPLMNKIKLFYSST